MICRFTVLFLFVLSGLMAEQAESISRREVLAAIAVLEKDITSADAPQAAAIVTRFGKESEAVLITVGPETLPWVRANAPEPEATIRAMLMAVYFAGDIKSQLEKRRPEDDPYRGWLAVIKAYRQILRKQPEVIIPEVEELIRKEQAGTLRQDAEELRQQQEQEEQRAQRRTNMV